MSNDHRPMLVHWDTRHSTPAEVCGTCSSPGSGVWVPVTFCPDAKAKMDADPGSLYAAIYEVIDRGEEP